MRTVVHIALICLLIARGSAPAHAAGACSNRYFLPVTDGATWVFSNEPKPRTIENVQKDNFEVHSAYDSQYNDQPDIFDVVDTYQCGSDGFGLLQHSEISEVAQGSQFGGIYQGVILPASVAPGSDWQYTYVLSGTIPTDPPQPDEVRDQVTEHFHANSPGTLTLGDGRQLKGLQVQHTTTIIEVTEGRGETGSYTHDQVDFLAEGVGWVNTALVSFTPSDPCPDQATIDGQLHATEDGLVDQSSQPGATVIYRSTETRATAELRIAQASLGAGDLVKAFGTVGIGPDQVRVDSVNGLQRFVVRLDSSGQPLLSLAAIDQLIASTCVQPGSLQGASTLLLGSVQQQGDQVRITARLVDVTTGTVQAANLADGTSGTLGQTLQNALGGLPLPFSGT